MLSGHLYPLGWYLSQNRVSHLIMGLAQHSETGDFHMLDATDPHDWKIIPLKDFAEQNANGKGPAYALVEETSRMVNFLGSALEPGIYQHFKGRTYTVYGTVRDEDGNLFVLYRPTYGQKVLMLRPFEMFTEEVDRPEIPYQGPRFWRQG
jgi:hypothetical protein